MNLVEVSEEHKKFIEIPIYAASIAAIRWSQIQFCFYATDKLRALLVKGVFLHGC